MMDVASPLVPAPPASTLLNPRFTRDGDEALERHLKRVCARVLSGIRGLIPTNKLQAVLLAGGYGRGEGGVLRGPTGDRPYNDLEFNVVLVGNRHLNELRFHRRLEVLGEILTHLADVEVEFKITSLRELAASPVSMFSYDLVSRHRFLGGPTPTHPLPGCDRHRRSELVAPMEATRLLMNRCSGLLFARVELERVPFTSRAADFIRRNIAKAQLACGDAVLAGRGLYDWSCLERHRRLAELARTEPSPWLDALLRHHAVGVDFKLHPRAGGLQPDVLEQQLREVTTQTFQCWLRLETHRLAHPFFSALSYANFPGNKCPGTAPPFNFLLNLRAGGLGLRPVRRLFRHPRERVLNALALLLWEPATLAESALHGQLDGELHATTTTFANAVAAYRRLWLHVR